MHRAATGALVDTRWRMIRLILIVGLALAWLGLPPPSFWFEVRSLAIADTTEGMSPIVRIDRTIHRHFRASWIVTVMRSHGSGFTFWCNARSSNDYAPDAQLPDHTDLGWWMDNQPCLRPLVPGNYRVRMLWTIKPTLFPEKEVRIESNTFTVHP